MLQQRHAERMNAMAAETGTDQVGPTDRRERGAFAGKGARLLRNLRIGDLNATESADDWPAYRHDNARTGATKSKVPAELVKRWETKIGTRASAPVIAAGMVFAADVDGHAVCALNAADGKIVWRFAAEGRVDSPPTYHQGLVLFGSRDGSVYCLRASDGALAWRFRPLERAADLRLRAARVGLADLRQRLGP